MVHPVATINTYGSVVTLDLSSASSVDKIWTLGPTSHVEVTLFVTHGGVEYSRTTQSVLPSKRNTPSVGIHPCLDRNLSIQLVIQI